MKTHFNRFAGVLAACALLLAHHSHAASMSMVNDSYERDAGNILSDVVIFRPAGLIMTVGGSAIFLAALPFSSAFGGTKKVAQTLVKTPARWTFERPFGGYAPDEFAFYED